MLDPIKVSQNITEEFISYISTRFHISDAEYRKNFLKELQKNGNIAKGPYLDITDSFETGRSIHQMIDSGVMSKLFRELEPNVSEKDKEIKLERPLYLHQEKAITKSRQNRNLVVTTGTGSGKTECFLLPILNYLLNEKENGTLSEGVRAILIYPMNALANDQMKRLRAILADFPSITFGVYNSSTKYEDAEGRSAYGRIFKDSNGNALKPLPNELISRKTMQCTPPNILVTNYAMLEYMLLRPKDDHVFSGSKLKFIVLDEAHTYRGATGIETSLLLRRLKARVSDSKEVLHILTSATLGGNDANKDIVKFAETLCDTNFLEDDIIRSNTVIPKFPEKPVNYPLDLYSEIASQKKPLKSILDHFAVKYNSKVPNEEILYDFCLSSLFYKKLRECVLKPTTVSELTKAISESILVTDSDVVNIINIASHAIKNKTALIKARYHMFIRALEGMYITLGEHKCVFLNRKKYTEIENEKYRVFEAVVCDDCGRIGIVGKEINGILEFESNRWKNTKDIYLLHDDSWELNDNDELENETIEETDYLLCVKCGRILHESQKGEFDCDCGEKYRIRVHKAQPKGNHGDYSCPCCHSGILRSFYLGYDAATAVLGTELFEQLPEKEVLPREIAVHKEEPSNKDIFDDLFSINPSKESLTIQKNIARQFLAFSDSRSDAAFFACYMTTFYNEFLRRRAIWHVIKKNLSDIENKPWEISALVDELTAYFDENHSFSLAEESGTENRTSRNRKQAWIAVLNEMVNARRSTSLVSLGIMDFSYKGIPSMERIADRYSVNVNDVKNLFQLLIKDIVYFGAVESKNASLTANDREYIYYTSVPKRIVKCKKDVQGKRNNLLSWLPRQRTNGTYYSNVRIKRTMQVLGIDEDTAIDILGQFWDFLAKNNIGLKYDKNDEYYISTDNFQVVAGNDEKLPLYGCQKCGRTTIFNCQDRCTAVECDGKLINISRDTLLDNNHYARLYSNQQMSPLHIKEHTAQLGREEQEAYQEMFVNKKINVLSCSTTFEMGVDVGDLETVFLRDMPPTPANYVQRAGRAGRSIHSAAYALTYAKLSSHDFTYFDNPIRMISGTIGVPVFQLSNEKIVRRHIFAVALSAFFSDNSDVYNNNDADILLNDNGYEKLVKFLKEAPKELYDILHTSIPESFCP